MGTAVKGMVKFANHVDMRARLKPKGMENYLTINELAELVGKHRSRIQQLEKKGTIPSPVRVTTGGQAVRLYSPRDVKKVQAWFKEHGYAPYNYKRNQR